MIVCGIATLKEREVYFRRTIESLYPQVDVFVVTLNGYDIKPTWIKDYPKIMAGMPTQQGNIGARAKFIYFSAGSNDIPLYYATCDDDLIYPPTYIEDMRAKVDKYKCIVSLHGKKYDGVPRPIPSYKKSFTTNVHCLHTQDVDVRVDVGGTGVMMFHTSHFVPDKNLFIHDNMVDVQIARMAYIQNVPIIALAHRNNYLKYQLRDSHEGNNTLWRKTSDADLTKILNSFL